VRGSRSTDHLSRTSFPTNWLTSQASTPLAIAAVYVCDRDLRWTTINRAGRFCRARFKAVNGDAMEGRTVFAALVSTSHNLVLGRYEEIHLETLLVARIIELLAHSTVSLALEYFCCD